MVLAYLPTLSASPLAWDDADNIFANPHYLSGSYGPLWTAPYYGMYIPVTSTIWGVLHGAGGGATWPFRMLNIVIHLANIALVARLATAFFRRVEVDPRLAVPIAVVIFGLHPEQTATVSWISGGRDLLSTFFALAAMALYLARRGKWWTLSATAAFALSLLSKPGTVALPLALLLYVSLYDLDRLRETAAVAAGWLAMSVGAVLVTRQAQSTMILVATPVASRMIVAADALGFYLLKFAWPFPLAADYGRNPQLVIMHPRMMLGTLTTLIVSSGLVGWTVRRFAGARLALLWPVLLLPVLGLVPFTYQRISTVADHYAYLPIAVLSITLGAVVARWFPAGRRAGVIVSLALGCALAIATRARTADWMDDQHFFTDMLRKNPASVSAVNNLANLAADRCDRGDVAGGLKAVATLNVLPPWHALILSNESYCLMRAGRDDEVLAMQAWFASPRVSSNLDSFPRAAGVLASSIAASFISRHQLRSAFPYLCEAAAVDPDERSHQANLSIARDALSHAGEAVTCPGRVAWKELPGFAGFDGSRRRP